jgi:phage tail sheath protein FI
MTAPFFTTNDSDATQLEGVYIKETNPPATVQEISLNSVGVFGVTLKGPVGYPVNITSEQRFIDVFGGGYLNGVNINKVWTSILNKGFSNLYVARVAAAAAVAASFTTESVAGGAGVACMRIDASSVGSWGNSLKFKVAAATDAVANHFDLFIQDTITGKIWQYKNIDIVGGDNTLTVVGSDDGRPVTLTKIAATRPVNNAAGVDGADTNGYTSLGQTVASFTSVVGSDGAVADSDYFGTGKGLNLLDTLKGPAIVYCAEYTSANLKASIKTSAAASSDRIFLIGATDQTILPAAAITDVASYQSDRIVYCYNHAYTIDPITGTEVLTRPEAWMAAVLANTDVDIHPGEQDTKRFLAGITRLYNQSLTRQDYINLRAAGISAMETDLGDPVFVSGVVTLTSTPGKTEIARRRMADFLQLSAAYALRYHVKKKNTDARRQAISATLKGWLSGLKQQGRVVEDFLIDMDILNSPTDRSNGIQRILMRVKLVPHMLSVVLTTEIGTGVTITTN